MKEIVGVYTVNEKNKKVTIKEDKLLINWKINFMIFTCPFALSTWW